MAGNAGRFTTIVKAKISKILDKAEYKKLFAKHKVLSSREYTAREEIMWERYVKQDPRFYRPAEVDELLADPAKARERLCWRPRVTFEELVREMVDADLASYSPSASDTPLDDDQMELNLAVSASSM